MVSDVGHGEGDASMHPIKPLADGTMRGDDKKAAERRTILLAMEARTSPPPRTFFLASPKGTASGPDLWREGEADGWVNVS